MSDRENIQQRLLEWQYGLLSENEVAELQQQIADNPEIVAAAEDSRRLAELIGRAASLPQEHVDGASPLKLSAAAPTGSTPAPAITARPAGPASVQPAKRRQRWLVASLALAGLYFAFLVGGDQYLDQVETDRIAQAGQLAPNQIKMTIEQTAAPSFDSAGKFLIQAALADGDTSPVQLRASVVSRDGHGIFAVGGMTDALGRLLVALPANLSIPDEAEFRVEAACEVRGSQVTATATGSIRLVATRYLTHLAMDRTLYRPGEVMYYRSLSLERFSLKAEHEFPVHFEIRDPGGSVLPGSEHEGITTRGVGSGVFAIPPGQVGGEYTLVAHSPEGSFPDEVRKFHIQNYRVPRLRKELEFQKDSYGPGDLVVADFTARLAEGGPVAGASLTISAVVDEQSVLQTTVQADDSGAAHIEFRIPENVEIGDGRLSIVVDDGGTRETLTKTIPIQLDRIEVTFYPAGGDLVPGLENAVYFVARNAQGDPVHIAGDIVDSRSRSLAQVETQHDGMGRFEFTPAFGESWRLVLSKPAGLRASFDLPAPNAAQTVVIDAGKGVFSSGSSPDLVVSSAREMPSLLLTAYCRGALMSQQVFAARTGSNTVALSLPGDAGGVLRVTVHDNSVQPPKPLAERLIYRRTGRELSVKVVGNEQPRAPGERARLELLVTNEHGEPVPAALGIAVVDDSTLVLADDHYPNLQTHFLVTSEVSSPEDLEDAEFYLSDDPEAEQALDLLLGTQGWRRFVEKRLVDLQQDPVLREQVARLQALGGVVTTPQNFNNVHSLQNRLVSTVDVQRMRGVFQATCVLLGIGILLNLLLSAIFGSKPVTAGSGTLPMLLIMTVSVAAGVTGCGGEAGESNLDATSVMSLQRADFADDAGPMEEADQPASNIEFDLHGAPADMLAKVDADPALASAEAPPGEGSDTAVALGSSKEDRADEWFGNAEGAEGAPLGMGGKLTLRFADGTGRFRLSPQEIHRFRAGLMNSDELASARFVVREYSYRQRQRRGTRRDDFAETLYWNPLVIADAQGRATIEFDLSDSITTFRVSASAHSNDGRIGSGEGEVISRRPFYLEPKLPLEVTVGDRVDVPVAVVNGTSQDLQAVFELQASNVFRLDGSSKRDMPLVADARTRAIFPLEVVGLGDGHIDVIGSLNGPNVNWKDSVRRPLTSVSQGFPIQESLAGVFAKNDSTLTLQLPDRWTPNSLRAVLRVFPSRVAEAQQSLEGMLREPGGCFEQTTSSNYPNTMVLRLMSGPDGEALAGTKLETIRRAKKLLAKGYARLAGYESASGGFEWFGGDPGHEALTAFGLMQFYDMMPVYPVDTEMLDRTTKWLLSRRNGEGGFQINPRFLHNWGAPEEVLNAYIVWALTETHAPEVMQQLSRELSHLADVGQETSDPYLLALCAASLANAEQFAAVDSLLDRLSGMARDDGSLEGAATVTVSRGISRTVETTALAALAWQKRPSFSEQAGKAVQWLRSNRQGSGHFGSTQATVLALKALLNAPDKPNTSSNSPFVVVSIGETEIGRIDLSQATSGAPSLTIPAGAMEPGENTLNVTNSTGDTISYAVDLQYYTDRPANDDRCPLRITTSLSATTAAAGEVISLEATLLNATDSGQPMSMVSLGLPAGLEPRTEQLDELKEQGVIDFYELRNREVICYWRSLEANQQIDLRLDLTAEIPGSYTGPASRTWLYYTAEQKHWADPLQVEITQPDAQP
jgi:hypothetical protein